jgi:hypothetical protein
MIVASIQLSASAVALSLKLASTLLGERFKNYFGTYHFWEHLQEQGVSRVSLSEHSVYPIESETLREIISKISRKHHTGGYHPRTSSLVLTLWQFCWEEQLQ